MLNEAPDNNDITHVTNIMLNKAPNSNDATLNSNDATCMANNVHLTTMGIQQFSMAAI